MEARGECEKRRSVKHPMLQNFHSKTTCIPMFIAALFARTKTWKPPKCPWTGGWIKKMWYIYTIEYYSALKKNKIMPFAVRWMQLEMLILSEVSQKEKDNYHMTSHIWNLIYSTNEPFPRKENHGHGEQTCGCQVGGGGSGLYLEFAVNRCKILPLEWICNEILLFSTRNYI